VTTRDPIELITAINPVPSLTERLTGDADMLATIMANPVAPLEPATRRRRRRALWTGAGVVVVGASLAAFAFIREAEPRDPISIACYSSASNHPAALSGQPMSSDPVATCGRLWMNGEIASLPEPPLLTACVLKTGLIAVIPGNEGICSQLGLANWVGELSDDAANSLAFYEAAVAKFGDRCLTLDDLLPRLRTLMEEFGVADWPVIDRGGYSETKPCAAVAVSAETKTIIIIPKRGTLETD
jgi:hypothetical protein